MHKRFCILCFCTRSWYLQFVFGSIPSRFLLSFSRISILVLSSSQSEIWTVDGFECYRVDKKIGTFHQYHTGNHLKEKRLQGKKNKGTLTVPFVADDIALEHKFSGLGPSSELYR